MADRDDTPAPVSFAVLALCVSGAGVLFLGLTTAAVALLPVPPVGRAVVALIGVVLTIAAMGVASKFITDRAIRGEYGDGPDGGDGGPLEEPPASGEGDEKRPPPDGLG